MSKQFRHKYRKIRYIYASVYMGGGGGGYIYAHYGTLRLEKKRIKPLIIFRDKGIRVEIYEKEKRDKPCASSISKQRLVR